METSLHRQLKALYADGHSQIEAPLDGYRIDVLRAGELIEIQHGSLAAIRDKVRRLLAHHRVRVVKPIVARKQLVNQTSRGGRVVQRRLSPKRGRILDLFHELVYFTRAFPHENLTLEVPLVEVEEWRYPGHGKRRRRRERDHEVEDQRLTGLQQVHQFHTATDLLELLPQGVPQPFDTGQLANQLDIPRWFAQRIAYCLRQTGAVSEVGKQGNTRLYRAQSA
jgi:hypothetical protein